MYKTGCPCAALINYRAYVSRDRRPKSLAELTGRQVPNLLRSLRMMEGYGLVALKRHVRGVEPVALATEFTILLG